MEKVKKQRTPKNKKVVSLNDNTTNAIDELADKMGVTDNAVVSFAVHKLHKEIM